MTYLGVGVLSLSMFLAACEDPAANKARAVTQPALSVAAAAMEPRADGLPLAINQDNSKVEFTGSKVTGSHLGGFRSFAGTIDLVNNDPERSGVAVEIDVASVYTDAEGLTKHLQTSDFFEVVKYPKASFVSSKIVADPAKGDWNYTVTGDLELRGERRSVTFPAVITVGDSDVAVEAEFSINRKDFGIVYAGKADDLIRNDVVIKLDLRAPKR